MRRKFIEETYKLLEGLQCAGKTLNRCKACKWLRMFEAVSSRSRLKTAAKVENCFKSLALMHMDCFKIVAKVANCWRINLHCCRASKLLRKSIIFPEFQQFSLHLREFWLRVVSFNVQRHSLMCRDISICGNTWVSIFATSSEQVLHTKVVGRVTPKKSFLSRNVIL